MNERIKELAQEFATFTETMTGVETEYIFDDEDLERFAELVRQDERDAWRNAAIRLGEELSSVSPDFYYDMTAKQWLDWALDQQPRGKNSLPAPPQAEKQTHTDHPMRHWDRTCSACVEQEPQYKPVATIHIRYGTALVDCPCCANKLTITFTDPPQKEWVGLTDEEVSSIEKTVSTRAQAIRAIESKLKEKNT